MGYEILMSHISLTGLFIQKMLNFPVFFVLFTGTPQFAIKILQKHLFSITYCFGAAAVRERGWSDL